MPREATWLDGKGGHVALDFVNTVSWRHDAARFVDRLDGPAAVATWTAARNLPVVTDATAAEVRGLRALREAIHDVALARAEGTHSPDSAAATLERAAAGAVTRAHLDLAGGARWTVPIHDGRSLHDHLALTAVELLAAADPVRLHQCADHDCGWIFLDTSRSGTRRWCDAAGCGNRARARRHQARNRRSAA